MADSEGDTQVRLRAVEGRVSNLETTVAAIGVKMDGLHDQLKKAHDENREKLRGLGVWVRWGVGIGLGAWLSTNVHLASIFHQ